MTLKGKPVAALTPIGPHTDQSFEATPEEERELLEAIAGVERGETVRAEDLLKWLRR